MRRNVLIVLAAAVLVWGVLAIALGSATLKLSGSSVSKPLSPACLSNASVQSAALPGTGVDVSPAPESATANPHTQISFLGAPAAQIGSTSRCAGRAAARTPAACGAYSQGDGASFVPGAAVRAGRAA